MTLRFESFEVNLEERELRKSGIRIPLQHKPFRILELLLRQPGSLVTRQQLAKELWPGLHVNFEKSLNSAINSLRHVLGDSSQQCRFIETRCGLGYRFIAPIESVTTPESAPHDYLRGRFFLNKMTTEGVHRAVGYFQSALQNDPGCSLALTGLADAHCQLALSSSARPADVCNVARELVTTALRLAPNLPEAHVSLGRLRMIFDWDWVGAETAFTEATTLNPGLAETHRSHGLFLSTQGRHDHALRAIRQAEMLDPLSLPVGYALAWLLYLSEDFQGAAMQSWKVLSLEPAFAPAQTILGLAYQQLGSYDEALTELENAAACSEQHPSALAALGYFLAVTGATSQAEAMLDQLTTAGQRQYVSSYWPALIYQGLGQPQKVIEALQTACLQRDPLLLWLRVDPRFDEIHKVTPLTFPPQTSTPSRSAGFGW
jgi:DNA-binding winged helix-turn-helix (wHTH) protein/Flp pilus assembly protein TadD